ncbi:Dps family protein [Haloferula sargassicola]|uniref:DNA protection during starvation protein n=1 Tax=Haloferula sargassicola TaxID=490096 RepID=A0ABP9UIL2_9BACT
MKSTPSSNKTSSKPGSKDSTAIRIGLDAKQRGKSAEILKAILANQHVLYLKTRNFHWNLVGPRFHSLHLFLEEQYQRLAKAIDETAERVRMLGEVSPGSMQEFLDEASLKECSGEAIHGLDAISVLRADHESVIRELRESIDKLSDLGDAGTEDFVTGLIQDHEQIAWMLRSHEA